MAETHPPTAWDALRVRDFRLLSTSLISAEAGRLMQRVALFWVLLQLTGSAVQLGIFGAMFGAFSLVLSPWSPWVVERWGSRRPLAVIRVLQGVSSLGVAVAIARGEGELAALYVAGAINAAGGALFVPLSNLLAFDAVGDRLISPALGFVGASTGMMRIAGPAAGGLTVGILGGDVAFAIQGALLIFAAVPVVLMHADTERGRRSEDGGFGALREGFRYAARTRAVAVPLLASVAISALVLPYVTYLPIVIEEVGGGANEYGIAASAAGLGIVAGSLLASAGYGGMRLMLGGAFFYALLVAVAAQAPNLAVLMSVLASAGIGFALWQALSPALAQSGADEEHRPRVMGLYGMTFSLEPATQVLLGLLVAGIGVRSAISAWAGAAAVLTLALLLLEARAKPPADRDRSQPG